MSSAPRVLIIGANGFVGRYLTEHLSRGGHYEVVPVGRQPQPGAGGGLDISDRESVLDWFRLQPTPDVVVHLAAIAHKRPGSDAPGAYDRVNHQGLVNVLDAARQHGVRRLIFFSSAAVYGEIGRTAPVNEDVELSPIGPYARSKAQAEAACLTAIHGGFDCIIFRPPAIYAPDWLLDVRKRAYVPLSNGRLLLSMPGAQPEFSLCAVENVTCAVELAVKGMLQPGIYNVADGAPYTQALVREVIGELDDVRRRIFLPRWLVKAPIMGLAAMSPTHIRTALLNNYWKLFHGLVLDTRKLAAAGYQPQARLQDLV